MVADAMRAEEKPLCVAVEGVEILTPGGGAPRPFG